MSTAQTQQPVTVTLTIGGMHCPACSNRVTKALGSLPGVRDVQVSLEKGQATVTYEPTALGPELLQQAVVEAGYTVEERIS